MTASVAEREGRLDKVKALAGFGRTAEADGRWRAGGVAARILLSMALVGLPVTVIAGYLVYRASSADQLNHAQSNLATNVATAVDRFTEAIATARSDVLFLSRLPSIDGIVRAHEAGNAEGETAWKDRLIVVFGDLLASRPDYFQVRFIGVDGGGREVVRVDRSLEGTVAPVPEADLQPKGDRDYYIAAAALPEGEVHISAIDLNRERGEIEIPYRPTYRVATPVYDADGVFRGVVVVNVASDSAFADAASSLARDATLFIANQDGDYLFAPDAARTFGFEFGQRYFVQDDIAELTPLFDGDAETIVTSIDFASSTHLLAAERAYFDPDQPERFLAVAAVLPLSTLSLGGGALYTTVAVVVAVLLVAGLIQLAVLMRTVVVPIRQMQNAVAEFGIGGRGIDLGRLPARKDEIGELAQAFDSMTARIAEREEELVEKAEELAQSNQELSQFAYVASHDLQEPLRMVASYLGLLSSRYRGKLDQEADEFIGYAVDGAERMKRLINDLLSYSRANNRALNVAPVNAKAVVDRVLDTYAGRIEETGASVEVEPLPEIRVDETQIERLFANLVDNALKYRAEATPRIVISAKPVGRFWEFSIADNGIGIDPKFHGKVFEIFARLHGRDKYPGTGIGLASCRRVVERHGGRIWIESPPGGGTAFKFTLPAVRDSSVRNTSNSQTSKGKP